MENDNYPRKRMVSRQSWKLTGAAAFAHGTWNAVYSALKIAVGAIATVLIIAAVCAVVFVGLLAGYLEGEILPQAGVQLEGFDLNEPSYLYSVDDDGDIQVLQRLHATNNSDWVAYEDIPKAMVDAAVSIEDHRFWEHQGVDWFTTIKACVNMFVGSGDQFGGSSITQQLIKNLLLTKDEGADDVTVQRKVLEIFRATEFEKRYDKTVVMEWYLNKIFLGNRCEGVKAAAAKYFGKELEHLTPAECATIISITNNPSLFNPYRTRLDGKGMTGMQRNEERRINTLYMMREYGYLTEEEYQAALSQEIVLKDGIDFEDRVYTCQEDGCGYHGKYSTFNHKEDGKYYCPVCSHVTNIGYDSSQEVYSYFVDTVIEDLVDMMAKEAGLDYENVDVRNQYKQLISNGGYHIYTTLDRDVQAAVDEVYTNLEAIPTTRSIQQLQSGIVIIDNRTGNIVALAGGVGKKVVHDGQNRAVDSNLQPGSSIKPLTVYAPAFEIGLITPASIATDMPVEYNPVKNGQVYPDGSVEVSPFPKNDTRTYGFSFNIQRAVRSSINACAVNTLNTMGLEYSYDFAKNKFGLSWLTDRYVNSSGTVFSDINMSPLGMGAPTIGVSVRQMAQAYATFPNDGVIREARTFTHVYNSNGDLIYYNDQTSEKILSDKAVNYMNFCLDKAVESGTGYHADISGQNVAGKTGTTSSQKDRWFCGFTGYYTAAVWCGYDVPEPIYQTGDNTGNAACQLFKKVMTTVHKDKQAIKLYDDSSFVEVGVCLDSGKLATDACAHDVRGSRVEYGVCLAEDAPTETCNKHVMVNVCSGGYATEYCQHFADAGQATFGQTALLQMTKVQVEAIAAAGNHGLASKFLQDNYIYLVDGEGNPQAFYGLYGNINAGISSPYVACTVHTKEAWQEYLAAHPNLNVQPQPSLPTENTEE